MSMSPRPAVLILGTLTLWGCHPSGAWPAEGKQTFIAHCQKSNLKPGECDCVAKAMEKTMTWAEFQAFSDVQKGGALAPEKMAKVREAVAACSPEETK